MFALRPESRPRLQPCAAIVLCWIMIVPIDV
jgi:hypothetical protein